MMILQPGVLPNFDLARERGILGLHNGSQSSGFVRISNKTPLRCGPEKKDDDDPTLLTAFDVLLSLRRADRLVQIIAFTVVYLAKLRMRPDRAGN